jgi:hypothetical protein
MNFLKKFWSGDCPLVVTFWGGFLAMISLSVALAMALGRDSEVLHGFLTFPIAAYFLISIWRSAEKYQGKRIWKDLSLLMVIFWWINISLKIIYIIFFDGGL